jgi:3-phenylpropionate/trans-cinnamate dioxygenase ferredoxin reductase subunit
MSSAASDAGVVVVGGGQAGSELVTALRQQGFAGRITLIGDEPYVPYRRPPLSKTFLSGEATQESLYIKPHAAYEKHGIECRLGIGVEAIERDERLLRLYDGTTLPYEVLALTTGGRARRLSLPGAEHPNVHYVRTLDDIARLRDQFKPGKRLLIIGGGYIGLEAASVGIKKGLQVTVVEALPRVLARVTAPEISAFYERVHRDKGVDVRTGVGVHSFEYGEHVETVVLADGTRLPADLIIVGVGLIPNTELADAAGLEVSNGIVVDAYCRTSDPNIYAAGDCTNHDNGFLGRRFRLESVPNAIEQGRIAASAICGKPVPYNSVPWFWSDQYDLKLQMVGISQGYDRIVIRGDMNANSFCAFYLKDGVVISADGVNRAAEFMVAKKLVADRVSADPGQLADESIALKSLIPPAP